jgi:hypothetical protein
MDVNHITERTISLAADVRRVILEQGPIKERAVANGLARNYGSVSCAIIYLTETDINLVEDDHGFLSFVQIRAG